VVDRQLVLLLLQRLEVRAGHEDQHVARDHLLRLEAGGVNRLCLSQRLAVGSLVGRPAGGTEIRQQVVEAVVAEDGGEHRVALEDPVPEPVGELVDGGVGVLVGHGRRHSLCGRSRRRGV